MSKPIHIFVRHNNKSVDRKKDVKPEWFSFQKCFDSLITDNVDITVCLDGKLENHNVDFRGKEVIEFVGGSDHASFDFLLETVVTKDLDAELDQAIVERMQAIANGEEPEKDVEIENTETSEKTQEQAEPKKEIKSEDFGSNNLNVICRRFAGFSSMPVLLSSLKSGGRS